jgi:hypothetical protein
LLCGSSDKGLQEKEEARAQRMLLLGTSFLPIYMPETQAEKSVKALLDEYAVRLAEAIEQRTRIVELWKALDTTPILLEASEEPLPPSVFGVSADFPAQLLQPLYRGYIKYGQLRPAPSAIGQSWAEPTLLLGHLMISYDLYALVIPEEKTNLFPDTQKDTWHEFDACAAERNDWLDSIGFDVYQHKFRDGDVGRDQAALSKVRVGLIYEAGITVRKGPSGRVELGLVLRKSSKEEYYDTDLLVSTLQTSGGYLRANSALHASFLRYVGEVDYDWPTRPVTIGPIFDESTEDDYPYDAYCAEYGGNCLLAHSCHHLHEQPAKVLLLRDCFDPEYWGDDDDFEEHEQLMQAEGWVDDSSCAKLLIGASNITFVPSIEEADPVAGAARAGSIAASILGNAMSASPENRISHILIDRVAMTAEAGLKFYEALIDTTRSALINI